MRQRSAIVTGITGGIGSAIGRKLREDGWFVVGLDRHDNCPDNACDELVQFDFADCENQSAFSEECVSKVMSALGKRTLHALINNAGLQILSSLRELRLSDWQKSIAVNLTAPMLLSQAFLPQLETSKGAILNIGSVHARATKREFVSYATTKAALDGFTRALAVDLGPKVRAICLAPAAISTPMLMAGFEGHSAAFEQLEACHPAGRIGSPEEVARAAAFLLSDELPFLTGSSFYLDGGVLARLNDPL
ncbi:SDR family NAD(P)-dependent oxidoreductase [Altericroceibacterium endophyticum]|uniref:SDR family oxidoreductase n=1 Tax=Altericroceibacterium endophyticum TaxID=1808508 RepID=A0A6I4TB33_9SPHN|nr:SDR family oxidoreductase [Altericroceibacterium endophyticum]MXO67080.1 SDR family oxidoreductase [Altericroceibacterium endophyticum]